MPIRPENKLRYPPEWPAIRTSILERAGHRCEWLGCGVRNYAVGSWRLGRGGIKVWRPLGGSGPCDAAGQGYAWPGDTPITYAEARAFAEAHNDWADRDSRVIVIVLTVAHLDHMPENCVPSNLKAWCQRHHLEYDQAHHAQTAYSTRKAAKATLDLFPELLTSNRSIHA